MSKKRGLSARLPPRDEFASEDERVRWLFSFLVLDLSTTSQLELEAVRRNAAAFAFALSDQAAEKFRKDTTWVGWPDLDALQLLKKTIREGIQEMREGDIWIADSPQRFGLSVRNGRVVRSYRSGSFTSLFTDTARDVVQDSWADIRWCPHCDSPFIKVGKQAYCKPACSQKARWERYIKKDSRRRDFRAERERTTRKRIGPNARIQLGRRRLQTRR